ncbi:hypothetical protein FRC10_008111 [Ceratobasidium sp. 414]|nr:hypothetical protein FRC10_008111 [Ceratobasidium sp. 414]
MQPTNNYAVQFDDSDTKTYVDVGVQTEPVLFQPATRHATGKAEATTGGRNFKFVPSTATGRSNRLTSAPKRVPQAQKKLPPTQPALRPSEPSPPLPEPHMDSRTVATVATSLEGHYVPHTLGSNHPPGPQGGPSNQNLAKSMQVQQGPHPAASASTSARSTLRAPGIAIPVPSNAPTRPVHQVQELPSPYNTPDAGMHQVFNGSTATPREPIPLIHNTLSSIGSSLLVPSFASSRANCLPTPDPSPGPSSAKLAKPMTTIERKVLRHTKRAFNCKGWQIPPQ